MQKKQERNRQFLFNLQLLLRTNFYYFSNGENTMSKKTIKPVSIALGAALVTSLAASNLAAESNANPFAMNELSGGYMQLASADNANKAEQEGKCGGKKSAQEGKCGEGKCGSKGEMKQNMEGKCGGKKSEQEGKCGEGKCGGSKK